ncbi:MAG: HAMP domain-containing histidine kinase [Bdellovibrionales bacterium]|nr:HAMP domain-containing histidine kinase [Bdellovibrionales bacterium]
MSPKSPRSGPGKKQARKPSAAESAPFGEGLAVGHRAGNRLSPHDEELFRAFQSNLLSLISHELRTPLMGILNALSLLQDAADPGHAGELPLPELVSMARNNAQKLHHALSSLLDLAAIESGAFRARLKEVDFARLAVLRIGALEPRLNDRRLTFTVDAVSAKEAQASPLLGDPQKLSRAVDLALEILLERAEPGSKVHFEADASHLNVSFTLPPSAEEEWETDWTQARAGFQGGVVSPVSAFAGTVRSERDFLTRTREGLGSEFLLVMEILRLHGGEFKAARSGTQVRLELRLPRLESEEGVKAVLQSRAYESSHGLASLAVALVAVPRGEEASAFQGRLRRALFRASDAVYALEGAGKVALVLDDCKSQDSPRLLERISEILGHSLEAGVAHCPEEGTDPEVLLRLANSRLKKSN